MHCSDLSSLWQGLCKTFRTSLGASWLDGLEGPVANMGQPLLVNDQTRDEAQHIQLHEAEQLMGMDAGTTAGPGIMAKN